MTWKYSNPKQGDIRVISKFCIFPYSVNGITKWLEFVNIKQQYSSNYADSGWDDIEFI